MHKFNIYTSLTLLLALLLVLFLYRNTNTSKFTYSYCNKYISNDGTKMSYTDCNSDPLCTVTKKPGTPYSCGPKSENSVDEELTNESPNLYPRPVPFSMLNK